MGIPGSTRSPFRPDLQIGAVGSRSCGLCGKPYKPVTLRNEGAQRKAWRTGMAMSRLDRLRPFAFAQGDRLERLGIGGEKVVPTYRWYQAIRDRRIAPQGPDQRSGPTAVASLLSPFLAFCFSRSPFPSRFRTFAFSRLAGLMLAVLVAAAPSFAVESPEWWRNTRAIYSAFALSGAGGPLMKYPSQDITKKLNGSFENLPLLLEDAKKLGTNCIYLVDYWEGGYENKGDYIPRSDLGGPEAFKRGVAALHAKGGRIILYLEAFIVTRTNSVGIAHPDWAMQDPSGKPYAYYGRDRFYLMYPGEGSGWTDYICGLAAKMVTDYGVDGFHLDSYGCQWDWKDHNPKHPGASDPSKFNSAAVNLVKTLRQRIQAVKPDAVVVLECCERAELLDVCDGGQIESAAWQYSPVKVLNEKPWVSRKTYKAFTSHYSMEENEKILRMGYNLSLAPWFLEDPPSEEDFEKMREHIKKPDDWHKRMRTLWHWDNLLYVNKRPRPKGIDLFQLRRDLEMRRYARPKPEYYETDTYKAAVEAYEPLIRELLSGGRVKTQAEYMRQIVEQAAGTCGGPGPIR